MKDVMEDKTRSAKNVIHNVVLIAGIITIIYAFYFHLYSDAYCNPHEVGVQGCHPLEIDARTNHALRYIVMGTGLIGLSIFWKNKEPSDKE